MTDEPTKTDPKFSVVGAALTDVAIPCPCTEIGTATLPAKPDVTTPVIGVFAVGV